MSSLSRRAAPTVIAAVARVARVAVLSNVASFDAKPDARAFHRVAEAAGVPVAQCVMIADSFTTDIAGAMDSGMRAGSSTTMARRSRTSTSTGTGAGNWWRPPRWPAWRTRQPRCGCRVLDKAG